MFWLDLSILVIALAVLFNLSSALHELASEIASNPGTLLLILLVLYAAFVL
jgi:hypothetical protein